MSAGKPMSEELSRRVANLSPAKLSLLMKRLGRDAGDGPAEPPPVVRRPPSATAPLSFSQRRLWFLDRLQPERSTYSLPASLQLSGRLDYPALLAALRSLLGRHEVLRATFDLPEPAADSGPDADDPVQTFHPLGEPPAASGRLLLVDLLALPPTRRREEAERLAVADARRPFDLSRGPLFRNALVRLGSDEHVLIQNLHHIVSDGWSRGILVRELAALYGERAGGPPARLPDLPVQYGDYCVWQRRYLRGEAVAEMADFWRRTLEDAPAETTLPGDRPRPEDATGAGLLAQRRLPAADLRAVEELARTRGATLFMGLLAGVAVLLHRYTGETDLLIGTPIANRRDRKLEGLVGFFVNNLVLRLDLSGEPTFEELLRRVREAALAAYAHQDLPFERLVEAMAPERGGSRPPIFQGMFTLENVPSSRLELAGLTFDAVPADPGSAKYDWVFAVERDAEEGDRGDWWLRVEYSTELYDAARVEGWMDHFLAILAEAPGAAERPIAELPALSAEQRETLTAGHRPAGIRRELLQARGPEESIADGEPIPPRNPLESRLVGLWAEVLGLERHRVGVHHNFFHLGGHSLLATRVLARLRRETGLELPVATFFEGPTIAELAQAVEVLRWAAQSAAAEGGVAAPAADLPGDETEEGEL